VKDDVAGVAAFVQPGVLKSGFACGFSTGACAGEEPDLLAFCKFFGEIGEDFGQNFAFASLRFANPRQPDPGLVLCLQRLLKKPGIGRNCRNSKPPGLKPY